MIRYLLDTDICVFVIKKKSNDIINRLQRIHPWEVGISSISISELEFGIVNSERPDQNRIALVEFLTPFEILNYDDRAAKEYGVIRKYLEESGAPIGALDTLIAAHALSLDCPLVTNNEREFSRVPGLRVENWAKIT